MQRGVSMYWFSMKLVIVYGSLQTDLPYKNIKAVELITVILQLDI
jgi:hypothetical protein